MGTLRPLIVAATLSLFGVQGASAQFYIGGHGGLNLTYDTEIAGVDLSFDPGFTVGFVAGYRVTPSIRFDGEVTYRKNDLEDHAGDVRSVAFFVNAYYDFRTDTPWTWIPYVGGGLGIASVELSSGAADDDEVFAYQFVVGVAYEFNRNLALTLDYRFMGTESPEHLGSKYDYLNSGFTAGLRYTF